MSELPELVDLSVIFPSLHIDLKYATADNITGAPIYREARCLLHTEAVTALAKSISIAAQVCTQVPDSRTSSGRL